eukprot:6197834-Pleurochrysis_carterae.AAC.3
MCSPFDDLGAILPQVSVPPKSGRRADIEIEVGSRWRGGQSMERRVISEYHAEYSGFRYFARHTPAPHARLRRLPFGAATPSDSFSVAAIAAI